MKTLAETFPFWSAIKAVTFDGNYLMTGFNDAVLRIHKVDRVNKILEEVMYLELNNTILAFTFSPSEKYLAIADSDNIVSIYDINYNKGELEFVIEEEIDNPIIEIGFVPEDGDETLKVFQLNNSCTILAINYFKREMKPIYTSDLFDTYVAGSLDLRTRNIAIKAEEIELNNLSIYNENLSREELKRFLDLQDKLNIEFNKRIKQEN